MAANAHAGKVAISISKVSTKELLVLGSPDISRNTLFDQRVYGIASDEFSLLTQIDPMEYL